MSGIAGYLGPRPEDVDASSACRSLSFTGQERLDVQRQDGFVGLAVSHAAGDDEAHAVLEEDGLCVLLDGYITQAGGRDLSPNRPGEALRACAGLYRGHGAGFARELNGSFALAVYDSRKGSVCLATDRLSSRPLRYRRTEGALAFSTRLEAFSALGPGKALELNPEGLAEFLVFSRLFDSNMWAGLEKVPPGTALAFSGGAVERHTYWECRFSYRRGAEDFEENAERLAAALQGACSRITGNCESVGLLLSGGMDSRTLLACLPESTICYTSCDYLNHETRLARKAARARGCRHRLLERGPLHYLEILPEAARAAEGAAEYHHAHIVGLTSHMQEVSGGVVLHGLNFDSILKGYCLPRVTWRLPGKRFKSTILKGCGSMEEAVGHLMGEALLHPEALDFLVPRLREEYRDYPRRALRAFVEDNAGSIVDPVDVQELFVFKDISRWSTFVFVESLRQRLPERWVAVDNDVVEIALTTPPEMRFDARLLRRALVLLDPRLARIPNASTFLPVRAGSALKLTYFIPDLLFNNLYAPVALKTVKRNTPPWMLNLGPWQDLHRFWRYGPIAGRLEQLLSDPPAMRDEVIDAAAVKEAVGRQRRGEARLAFPLARLLTFLEWRSRCPE